LKKPEIDKLVSDKKHKLFQSDFQLIIRFKDAEQSSFTKGNIEAPREDVKPNGNGKVKKEVFLILNLF
jgi:hypothetical protein